MCNQQFGRAVLFIGVIAVALFAGCSGLSDPDSGRVNQTDATLTAIDNELGTIQSNGADPGASKAVFSIGWQKPHDPAHQSGNKIGQAMAVAFNNTNQQGPPFARSGIDMGSVSLAYGSENIALSKKSGREGGVFYTTFSGKDANNAVAIDFVPKGSYEFVVSGASNFSAMTGSVTAPAALLDITSHADGQMINASNDIHLTWTGGTTAGRLMIRVVPAPPPPGVGPGPRRDGMGPGGGGPPHPPMGPKGIEIKLDTNPGEYTVTAAQLQGLLNKTNAKGIVCIVSQANISEVSHDGGTVRIALHNDDGVMLKVQ